MANANAPSKKKLPELYVLSGVHTHEVSRVDQTAIQRGFFLLKDEQGAAARRSTTMAKLDADTIKAILETKLEKSEEIAEAMDKAELSETAQEAVNAALKTLQSVSDEIPDDVLKALMALAGVGNEEAEKDEGAGSDKDGDSGEGGSSGESAIGKSLQGLSDEDRERIEKQFEQERTERVALEKKLAAETELREERDYIEKAAPFRVPHLPTIELAKMTRGIDQKFGTDSSEAKNFASLCATITKSKEIGELLKKTGSPGSGTAATPSEKLTAIAKSRVEAAQKNGTSLTYAAAYDQALKDNPDIYRNLDDEEMNR